MMVIQTVKQSSGNYVRDCFGWAATPPQVADSPPARGGNCIIRATTRRRHAVRAPLMLQNPHHHWCGGCGKGWRAPEGPEGLAAVPAGGGRAWPGCSQRPGPTGVEGAGGTCRGARGRWRGLAGLRDDAPSEARGADGSRAGRRPRRSTARTQQRARSAAAPRAPRVSVAHRLSWMLRPGTASISSRV